LSTQLEQTKNNYDQYKKRAHVLLEKNKEQKSDVTRITELEELVQQLTSQKTKYELEQAEKAEHQLLLEHDLRKAIDRIHELEASQNIMIKEKDKKEKMVDDLKQAAINDKKSLETSKCVDL
jgi:folate-binding Fe-S cluster repair protein YgfZ